ncbi:MAG: hypothetical protein IKM33_02025 [Clostridia bacterium]|nr:hypothetical protein [Clostridia bacterium]
MSLYRKKKSTSYTLWLTLLVAGIGFAVKSLLVHPVYVLLGNDVTHMNAWYTALLYYLIDGGLWDLAIIAVCYPASVHAVFHKGLKGGKGVILAFTLLTAGKFVLNYIMDVLTYSGLPRLDEFLTDLPMILIMMALELVPYALAVAVVAMAKTRYDRKAEMAAYQSELTETAAPAPVLPFGKLLSFRNPLQLASFVGVLAIFLSREVSYHVYQITLYANFGYTDGWLDMIVTLFSDVMISTLIYFAAILLLPHIHSREMENN